MANGFFIFRRLSASNSTPITWRHHSDSLAAFSWSNRTPPSDAGHSQRQHKTGLVHIFSHLLFVYVLSRGRDRSFSWSFASALSSMMNLAPNEHVQNCIHLYIKEWSFVSVPPVSLPLTKSCRVRSLVWRTVCLCSILRILHGTVSGGFSLMRLCVGRRPLAAGFCVEDGSHICTPQLYVKRVLW
jgi:hypothetical protein